MLKLLLRLILRMSPRPSTPVFSTVPIVSVTPPPPPPKRGVHVIPLKNGMWRVAKFSPRRARWWRIAWTVWWANKGHRLAISPEMWMGEDKPPSNVAESI